MGTRRSCLVLALVLLPAAARADRHNWEASAAVSAVSGSWLWGGNLSVAKMLHTEKQDKPHRWSVFVDLAKHAGPHDSGSLTQFSALGGPRFLVVRSLRHGEDLYRLQLFAQAMAGVVQTSGKGTDSAMGGGVGVDVLFSDFGGLRTQVDYVHTDRTSGKDGFFRGSVGLVYRFEKCPPVKKSGGQRPLKARWTRAEPISGR
jgi:hypothetical protein